MCTIAGAKVQLNYNCYNVYLNECLLIKCLPSIKSRVAHLIPLKVVHLFPTQVAHLFRYYHVTILVEPENLFQFTHVYWFICHTLLCL